MSLNPISLILQLTVDKYKAPPTFKYFFQLHNSEYSCFHLRSPTQSPTAGSESPSGIQSLPFQIYCYLCTLLFRQYICLSLFR